MRGVCECVCERGYGYGQVSARVNGCQVVRMRARVCQNGKGTNDVGQITLPCLSSLGEPW